MKRIVLPFIFLIAFSGLAFGHVRNIQDNFQLIYSIADDDGNHVSGETVSLKIKKISNGHYYDFNDNAFKASGWTDKSANLSEDSTEGFYYYTFNPPASETAAEQYQFIVDNASLVYGDHQSLTVDYQKLFDTASDTVTVGTNNDKTGYRLSATGVDDIWDEALAGHAVSGSAGAALTAASNAGDPMGVTLPGSYTGSQAGAIIAALKDYTDGDKESGNYSGIENLVRRSGN